MTLYYPPNANGLQKTLGAQLDEGTTAAVTLNNTTSIQNKAGVFVVNRIDSGGTEKAAALREYISFEGVSGSTLTGLTRGVGGGGVDQDHAVGSVVEFISDVVQQDGILDALDNLVDSDGALDETKVGDLTSAQTLTNKTLTSPVMTTPQINDTSADHQYIFAPSELAADRTVTLPLLAGNDTFTFNAFTATLTNKRITKRVTTIASSGTPTVNTDNCDVVTITAQAAAITSMTTNLSGTPTNFQTLIFRILDDGTGRAITWGAKFEARGVALPTTTTASKLLTVGFIYDTVDSIWGCVAVSDEA